MSQVTTDYAFAGTNIAQTDMAKIDEVLDALKSSASGATQPSNATEGMFWYDTTANILKIYVDEGSPEWQSIWDFGNGQIPTIPNDFVVSAMLNSTSSSEAVTTDVIRDEAVTAAKIADGALPYSKLVTPTAGTNLIGHDDEVATNSTGTYIGKKQFIILRAGTYTVSFRLYSTGSGYTANGRIYVNGVATGDVRSSTTPSWSTWSQNLTFAIGDYCQLYARGGTYTSAWVDNFRIYDNDNFGLVVPCSAFFLG